MSEEYVRARQEQLGKYYEEMSAFQQKARDEGTSGSLAFLKGMKAIGRKYGMVRLDGLLRYQGPTEEAEAEALRARTVHLGFLESAGTANLPEGVPDLFSVLQNDGRLSDTAIRVFAKFPLRKMCLGHNPPPLDFEGFIREVQRESRKAREGEWKELS
jgi:hypothetical protein